MSGSPVSDDTSARTAARSIGTRRRPSRRSPGGRAVPNPGPHTHLSWRSTPGHRRGSIHLPQTTISPHSPAYCAVGGSTCCVQRPKNRLVPGPTSSYEASGLTRNEQGRSSILLPGSKNRCNCKGFEISSRRWRKPAGHFEGGPLILGCDSGSA